MFRPVGARQQFSPRVSARWVLVGLLLHIAWLPQAHAWNESGHRVIAAAAAAQMSPQLRAKVVAALKAHPRYEEDLAAYRPKRLSWITEAQWLMGQAAQWPDHARRFENAPSRKRDALVKRYHRGNWHYINLPTYLARGDSKLRIADPTRPRRKRKGSAPDDVLTALRFMQAALQNPDTSAADKGLWVSWALHLIADVHQPLHTTAMFSKDRWPRGDRGGNDVKIAGTGGVGDRKGRLDSLHYFWDSAISNRVKPRELRALVKVLNQQKIRDVGRDESDPLKWIREGRHLAINEVYEPLRSQLLISPIVTIDNKYTRRTHANALRRGALAARRTALWLEVALLDKKLPEESGIKLKRLAR